MKNTFFASLSLLLLAEIVLADCPLDISGIDSANAFEENFEDDNLDGTGARSLDDFVNAAANSLFFTPQGLNFRYEIDFTFFVWPGTNAFAFRDPDSISMTGHVCNEIGQCRSVTMTTYYSGDSSADVDAIGSFILGGVFPIGINLLFPSDRFAITATDGTTRTDIRDFAPETLQEMAQSGDSFGLSTDNSTLSTACRNNRGEIVGNENFPPPPPPPSAPPPTIPYPTPPNPPGFNCRPTPTGVICVRTR